VGARLRQQQRPTGRNKGNSVKFQTTTNVPIAIAVPGGLRVDLGDSPSEADIPSIELTPTGITFASAVEGKFELTLSDENQESGKTSTVHIEVLSP
jgi:hypothetical protein